MMFAMSSFTILLLLPMMIIPLPEHPIAFIHHLLPYNSSDRIIPTASTLSQPALQSVISFIASHPTSLAPLLAYALLGGLGQLFIFETIQHFGSLTLVMVTVTRKLFTMLLSVVVFNHRLTLGQWAGVAVVFGGIGVEAGMKRREMMRRTKRD
jgi:UDP-galactose transporter B1